MNNITTLKRDNGFTEVTLSNGLVLKTTLINKFGFKDLQKKLEQNGRLLPGDVFAAMRKKL